MLSHPKGKRVSQPLSALPPSEEANADQHFSFGSHATTQTRQAIAAIYNKYSQGFLGMLVKSFYIVTAQLITTTPPNYVQNSSGTSFIKKPSNVPELGLLTNSIQETLRICLRFSVPQFLSKAGDEGVDAHVSVAPSAPTLLGLRRARFPQPGLKAKIIGFIREENAIIIRRRESIHWEGSYKEAWFVLRLCAKSRSLCGQNGWLFACTLNAFLTVAAAAEGKRCWRAKLNTPPNQALETATTRFS
ncbi:hypothetical protein PR048_025822 [Dryococelus australis]|uniref:Uncharacterized protein n=1 Tax=Dryococelus australis TaxID=614101 RepID=A0ABQ9GJL9_9NEOP|nr:hypothetical protein PR048_025822 [Dryococelus australis]